MKKFLSTQTRSTFKRLISYLIYVVALLYLFYWGFEYHNLTRLEARFKFDEQFLYFLISIMLFHMLAGIVLALPHFISIIRKQGQWTYNWLIFYVVGIPTFYVAITPLMNFTRLANIWPLIDLLSNHSLGPPALSGIAFGYILLSSFEKNILN